ncbi:1-deoxy-D-xylulose-5-phosphate reductoisomerase [Hoeflea prorocentri]|uniref:1-deoxy-D-xylulose 5-phosphate reductoisomerase n=1 Tax=Hoeflea prorocentri TaxID=1922333 RepID=A0A9X3UQP5_9HYPH|nr:1-deoxy-D-xylulose-5-phosphate reductoisomerase [Hoeflea prorocentri]MCY6383614.1 1-deoxy-D-xylulose-5-phosphate reductoisomerase [Hoeflea prorocentri]MDA5401414.1 1-deoxy-D-xylulose-5-phosphate reductoisomerase [Hoeflea prorocentri]
MTEPAGTAPQRLSIFGSTGSIGCNTLDVIRHLGGRQSYEICAITGRDNIDLLARQAIECQAEIAVTANANRYQELKEALSGTGIEVAAGETALIEAAGRDIDWFMAGIVGMAGLAPTLAAIRTGADIALANKECLVSAGELFNREIEKGGGRLLPVDSEHNAIFQVFEDDQRHAIERIILTASGGPFRQRSLEDMATVTPDMAAAHPNWSMGLKISIDSASMFNKALEMIEAKHLFRMSADQVEVVVHPQSVIHSMVGYSDGSILAQLGAPDMRTAIGYCLAFPQRPSLPVERLDFAKLARLDFEAPDEARFPSLRLARQAMQAGGLSGAILNGAKEVALEAFIAGQVGFLEMADIVETVMQKLGAADMTSIDAVFEADGTARILAGEIVGSRTQRPLAT